MKYLYLLLFLLIISIANSFSQQMITGRVVDFDTEKPIEGAIIRSDNGRLITRSNHLGYFQFNEAITDTFQIRRKGYTISNFALPGESHFTVKLNKVDKKSIVMIDDGYVKGEVQNHYRTGIWEFYDKPGVLALKYDFDIGAPYPDLPGIIYLRPDTSQYAIKLDTGYIMSHVDIAPRIFGTMQQLYTALSLCSYPQTAKKNLTSGTIYLMFEVTPNGFMGNFTVLNDIGDGVGTEVIKTLRSTPMYWIPAQKGVKRYFSRFIVPVTFEIDAFENGYQKSIGKIKNHKLSKADLPTAHILKEYIFTTVRIR